MKRARARTEVEVTKERGRDVIQPVHGQRVVDEGGSYSVDLTTRDHKGRPVVEYEGEDALIDEITAKIKNENAVEVLEENLPPKHR